MEQNIIEIADISKGFNPESDASLIRQNFSLASRLFGILAVSGVFLASFVFPLIDTGHSICAVRNMTGLACPGCGLTRSFAAITHGRIMEAFGMHPLGPFIFLMLGLYLVKWSFEAFTKRPLAGRFEDKIRIPMLWTLIVAMLAVWVFRLATGTLV